MFVQKAIGALLQDRDMRRSHNAELKAACEKLLSEVSASGDHAEGVENVSPLPEVMHRDKPLIEADRLFAPFEMAAAKSKSSSLTISALDSIQKLVAYGHIRYDFVSKPNDDRHFDDHLVEVVANCFAGQQTDEGVQLQVLKALLTIVTSPHVRVHENALLLSVRTCYNVYLASRSIINQTTAKATLNQMLNYIYSRMEAVSAKKTPPPVLASTESEERPPWYHDVVSPIVDEMLANVALLLSSVPTLEYQRLVQRDAFLVFRSLCRLSKKPLPTGPPDPKSHELRSKILSLQLLLGILQNGGEVFCNSETFVSAIRSELCVTLSQNGVSYVSEVFELSLSIFISLLIKYRKHLKSQMEIFFKEICLNILESSSSSFDQKWIAIQGIGSICNDAQIVVDIYVNYDCDLSAANIFERLVVDLSKIAQGRHAVDLDTGQNQLMRMRMKGLECLCNILKCMVEWSKDLYENPHARQKEVLDNSVDADDSLIESEMEKLFFIEKLKQHKDILERGFKLFSHKPTKGIKYLQENNIVGLEAEQIAKFLISENSRLDKTALGELLGDHERIDMMHHYVDLIEFSEMELVAALRYFLESFRLPGESQKIDRLMLKFASRYIECNVGQKVFASADAAYVLAFSIIMLTTDLHSSHVKKKMTKEEFIKNNRGINESEDLPRDYLSAIYDEIASSEIKVRSSSPIGGGSNVNGVGKKRNLQWTQESEARSLNAGALMESAITRSDTFTSAKHLELVKPMFKLIWSPLLANFSVGLQDSGDATITNLCIEGMKCAIRLADIFGLSLERNAFIQALARFTLLTDNSNIAEMKPKNMEAIRALISVAHSDGNYLESSWLDIMKCISQLENAQNTGSGSSGTVQKLNEVSVHPDSGPISNETNSQSILVPVDRLFQGSRNLSGDAICHFVSALCAVSAEEISHSKQKRIYSLTKLVEISYYNMERIRLEWSRIWQVLGHHFNIVGCNECQDIAFFAVDSLKQLAMKFLEKGELHNFRFQKDFLRPFEYIMKNNASPPIRDMVVRCLSQMVHSQSQNIQSGWKNIFTTFGMAASDEEETIVTLSFQTTQHIVLQLLDGGHAVLVDCFQDCVKCLSEFACNPHHLDIAMDAIHLIRQCAKYVHNHMDHFSESSSDSTEKEHHVVWVSGWFPVLFELSCIISRSKLDIRTRSLTVLFDIIKQYGSSFEMSWWQDLFGVLFRIFDVVKMDHRSVALSQHKEWMDTTCNHTLYALTDVFNEFFDKLAPVLLSDMIAQFKWCVQQDNEQLSRSGVFCLENLTLTNHHLMTEEIKSKILRSQADLVVLSMNFDEKHSNYKSIESRVQVHLEVVQSLGRILLESHARHPPSEGEESGKPLTLYAQKHFDDIMNIVDSLLRAHEHAKKIIGDNKQVFDKSIIPLLVNQETATFKTLMRILLELYHEKEFSSHQGVTEQKLLGVLKDSLAYFLSVTSKAQQDSWSDLLSSIFEEILNFPDSKFGVAVPVLYDKICDMLAAQIGKKLRCVLCTILKRVGTMYGISTDRPASV